MAKLLECDLDIDAVVGGCFFPGVPVCVFVDEGRVYISADASEVGEVEVTISFACEELDRLVRVLRERVAESGA